MGDLDTGTSGMERGPRVDASTADVDRLAVFLIDTVAYKHIADVDLVDEDETARAMVRRFDELEDILAELLMMAGRF
jgi:hypothetical protein